MNYRHIYHAGNFADVVKHCTLILLLQALRNKDKGFFYLETHAGRGVYNLLSVEAERTQEAREGIGRLWQAQNPPLAAQDLLDTVRALNPDNTLRHYPGSPWLAWQWLRAQDRMTLLEAHPHECAWLQKQFAGKRAARILCQDGWQGLKAWLPPAERRGLVFMDSPFEQPNEFNTILEHLAQARQRWATGCYAMWYPIKDRAPVARFHRSLQQAGFAEVLCVELQLYPVDSGLWLNGCGLAIANPPWQLAAALQDLLPALATILRQSAEPTWRVEWLVGPV